jgi:Chaperone for flagella basal body P-ring formation
MNLLRTLILFAVVPAGCLPCIAAAASIARGVEVTDPISGLHWLRVEDPVHPAAPPRLVLGRSIELPASDKDVAKAVPCVHAGDRVRLRRENGSAASLSMEATALGSGAPGDCVRARILVTGALVEMKISGPGAGVLSRETGKWR